VPRFRIGEQKFSDGDDRTPGRQSFNQSVDNRKAPVYIQQHG
jgi:hypothetical protein